MSALELRERLQLSFHGLVMASSALDKIEDTADPEIVEFRKALTSFMHHASSLCDKAEKRPRLNLVDRS